MSINLKLGGVAIQRVKKVRFLGLEFDERLDWGEHCKKMRTRTCYRRDALVRLARKQRFSKLSFIVKLHDVFINSIFRYGSTSTIVMSKKNMSDMEIYYGNCIRKYTGMPRFISRKLILEQAMVCSFKDMIRKISIKRVSNLIAFSPFGSDFVQSARVNRNTTYGSPCERLITT